MEILFQIGAAAVNMSIGFFILGLVFIVAGVYLHFRARLKSTDENRRITGILTLSDVLAYAFAFLPFVCIGFAMLFEKA